MNSTRAGTLQYPLQTNLQGLGLNHGKNNCLSNLYGKKLDEVKSFLCIQGQRAEGKKDVGVSTHPGSYMFNHVYFVCYINQQSP